jgi:hypothetical protein
MTSIYMLLYHRGTTAKNVDEPSYVSYDMIFNMYLNRPMIKREEYTWRNLSTMTVLCFFGKPKEDDSSRDICYHASLWLNKVEKFIIIADELFTCGHDRIIVYDQNIINLPRTIKNPLTMHWYLRNYDFGEFVLINDDDILTNSTSKIIENPLYFPGQLYLHNEGDIAQYRVLRKLYSYGGKYLGVPINPTLHGPMITSSSMIKKAYEILKLGGMSECRNGDVWSVIAAVSAIKAVDGYARYPPPNYHYYTQMTSSVIIPMGYQYYCLNDGPEIMDVKKLNEYVSRLFDQ